MNMYTHIQTHDQPDEGENIISDLSISEETTNGINFALYLQIKRKKIKKMKKRKKEDGRKTAGGETEQKEERREGKGEEGLQRTLENRKYKKGSRKENNSQK